MVAPGTTSFAKEMAVRKRIGSIYNKREEDFASLREYNDYLEEVEEMIVDLVEGINVPTIEARIAQYQKENAEQIVNAQARKAEEYAAALAASRGEVTQKNFDLEAPFSATATQGGQYAPAIAQQPRPMGMGPQPIPLGSGIGNEYEDEEMMKLRLEKAARAGGWSIEITKKRALEEAFCSI